MKRANLKFLGISIAIISGIAFVIGMNTAVYFLTSNKNSHDESKHLYINEEFNESTDKDVIKFFKDNTISIGFIKSSYEKVSGTAWLKDIDYKNNSYTFATNLHVASNFITPNQNNEQVIDPSVSWITIKYFDELGNDKLFNARTKSQDWTVSKLYANKKREIPSKFHPHSNTVVEGDKTYITNGYIDYIELTYQLDEKDESTFATWLRSRGPAPKIASQDEITHMLAESYNPLVPPSNPSTEQSQNYLYVAGFPIIDGMPTWVEQKFAISQGTPNVMYTTSVHEMSPVPWLDRKDGIKLKSEPNGEITDQRSISQQITMNGLYMGSGSSGSMICAKINDQLKVIAIWWGTYGKRFGAGDLLWCNSYNPIHPDLETYEITDDDDWTNWEGYNLTI